MFRDREPSSVLGIGNTLPRVEGGFLRSKKTGEEWRNAAAWEEVCTDAWTADFCPRSSSVSVSYCILATGKYRYLYSLRYADTWELWYDCPWQSWDFGFAARSTTLGGRVYMCALKHENRGLGIFPSPRWGALWG